MQDTAPSTTPGPTADPSMIDARGPRFSAAITMTVLAVALVVGGTVGTVLVAWQVLVFAIATIGGVRRSPYAALFGVARRTLSLGPATKLEPAAPPRFSQACGLAFAGAGLVATLLGAAVTGAVLVGIVLALSTLLATTGVCVGCELYLFGVRLRAGRG